jgi:uncharacterized protein YndB with AHSA1/START domain
MKTKSNLLEPAWAEDFFIAPIAEVWRALTDPELIVQWWGDEKLYHMTRVEHELRPGGSAFYGGKFVAGVQGGREFSATGVTRIVEAPTLLEYTRLYAGGIPIAEETLIRYALDERNGATRVCVAHLGFQTAQGRDGHADGWRRVLGYLENHFQAGKQSTQTTKNQHEHNKKSNPGNNGV